jgi:2,4-dienoyl-CoA reductase-like NADH-dependent reductase (Old Yellow Enzyme family)
VPSASLEPLMKRFAGGEFDLVAVGRVLLANPDWVAKMRDGRDAELKTFDPRGLTEFI